MCGLELIEDFLNALPLDVVFVPKLLQKGLQLQILIMESGSLHSEVFRLILEPVILGIR